MTVQGGEVTVPPAAQLFYLSQRPYLVAGSLRDQLTYPRPPAAVWAASSPSVRQQFTRLQGPGAGQVCKHTSSVKLLFPVRGPQLPCGPPATATILTPGCNHCMSSTCTPSFL